MNTDTPKLFRDAMRPIARAVRRWRVGEFRDRELLACLEEMLGPYAHVEWFRDAVRQGAAQLRETPAPAGTPGNPPMTEFPRLLAAFVGVYDELMTGGEIDRAFVEEHCDTIESIVATWPMEEPGAAASPFEWLAHGLVKPN